MKLVCILAFILFSSFVISQDLYLKKDQGKFGYQDAQGNWKIQPQYEDAWQFSKNLALVKKGGKWGYVNQANETIIPFELDKGEILRDTLAYVMKNGKVGLISSGGYFLAPKYDQILFSQEWKTQKLQNVRVREKGKWGVLDPVSKKLIVPAKFDKIETAYYLQDTAFVFTQNGLKGVVSSNGKILIGAIADEFKSFGSYNVVYKRNGKMGVVNKGGQIRLKPQFSFLQNYSGKDSLFTVLENEKNGLYRLGHGLIIPFVKGGVGIKKVPLYDGWTELPDQYKSSPYGKGRLKEDCGVNFGKSGGYNNMDYYSFTGRGTKLKGEPYPQKNGNIWVANPEKGGRGYYVYDRNGKLLTPKPLLVYKQIETKKGSLVIKSVGDKVGIYNPETKKWLVPAVHNRVEYLPKIASFYFGSNQEMTLLSDDQNTRINGITRQLIAPYGSDFYYFEVKEAEAKKRVIQIQYGDPLSKHQKISDVYEQSSDFIDEYGSTMSAAIKIERNGKSFYYNYVVDKEYGPISNARSETFSDGQNYYYYTSILMKNQEYILLDEVYKEVLSKVKNIENIKVHVDRNKKDLLVFQSLENGKHYCYNFDTRERIELPIVSYINTLSYDFTEVDEDPETNERVALEDYILVVVGKDEKGKKIYNGIRCNSLVFQSIEEFDYGHNVFKLKKDGKWGLYSVQYDKLVEPYYEDKITVESSMSYFLDRLVVSESWAIMDSKTGKRVYPWDFEPGYQKFGKYYHLFTYWYGKEGESENEEKVKLTQGEYTYLSPISELNGDFLDAWTSNTYVYLVKKNGKWGIIDIFENEIVPIIYDKIEFNYTLIEIFDYQISPLILHLGKETTIYDLRNQMFLLPFGVRKYDLNFDYADFGSPIIYLEDGRNGMLIYDWYRKQVKDSGPVYKEINYLDETYALELKKEGQIELFIDVNKHDTFKIDQIHKDLFELFWVSKGDQHYLMDAKGNMLYEFPEEPKDVEGDELTFFYEAAGKKVYCHQWGEGPDGESLGYQVDTVSTTFDFIRSKNFSVVYKENGLWYAANSSLGNKTEIGKKKPDQIYKINGQLILVFSKSGIELENLTSGKEFKSKKSKYVSEYNRNGNHLIWLSGERMYINENFEKVEIKKKK